MIINLRRLSAAALLVAGATFGTGILGASDWPEWRGPSRDGRSAETDLPSSWSPQGDNLAWRVPIGARSSPVAFRDRVYLLTVTAGDVATTQERLVALDAESGKVLWERRFSVYLSDVPQHRAAWASPTVDPETGNIFVFTVGAQLSAVVPGREGPLGTLVAGRIRRGNHPWRPDDLTDRSRGQSHPEHVDAGVG